jgi:hypothetical protein
MLMSERHPEFERLRQWQEGELSASEADDVAGHVAGCGFCSHRVERLASVGRVFRGGPWLRPSEQARSTVFKAFRQAYAPPPLRQLIARLVYDGRTMGPLPGVRADTPDAHQLLYTSADADVAISLREHGEGGWSLIGQVLPTEAALSEPAEVLVIANDQVAAQTTTTELGNFSIDGIAPGHYRVVVLLPHTRLELPELVLLP